MYARPPANGYGTVYFNSAEGEECAGLAERSLHEPSEAGPQGDATYLRGDKHVAEADGKSRNITWKSQFRIPENWRWYEGQWGNGLPHGTGILCFADGSVYMGEFKQGKRQGFGRYDLLEVKEHYAGEWRDDTSTHQRTTFLCCQLSHTGHGCGEYTFTSGSVYRGEWENGVAMGKCMVKYHNGSCCQRKRTFLTSLDNSYQGEWREGNPNGFGVMTYSNGHVFTGEWVDGRYVSVSVNFCSRCEGSKETALSSMPMETSILVNGLMR